MRTKVRLVAFLMALVILGIWFFGGRNMGFTKTSIVKKRTDPVTELEVNDLVPGFVPGLDFLGGGLAVAGVLGAASFFMPRKMGGEIKT